MQTVDEHGRIVADYGLAWRRNASGLWSISGGYFIEQLDGSRVWTLFRKGKSSYPEKISFTRQIIMRGSVAQCMHAAEIYDIRKV